MTDEPSARVQAQRLVRKWLRGPLLAWTGFFAAIESAILSHGRRERAMGMRDEYLTAEQVLDEIDKHGSSVVAEGARKRYGIDGTLPLHAIKVSLGLTPVTMYRRALPDPPEHRARETEGQT